MVPELDLGAGVATVMGSVGSFLIVGLRVGLTVALRLADSVAGSEMVGEAEATGISVALMEATISVGVGRMTTAEFTSKVVLSPHELI